MQKVNGILNYVSKEDIKLLYENPKEFWKDVDEIASNAFLLLDELTEIIIPGSCKKIDSQAFRSCNNLKSVYISEGVEEIEKQVFDDCINLKYVELPNTIDKLSDKLFYDSCLKSVKLPNNLKELNGCLFSGCRSLLNIEIPDSVEKIHEFAFSNCTDLQSIKLPPNIKEIGMAAFGGCRSLKEIIFPEGLQNLPSFVISDCRNIEKVVISSNIKNIEYGAFKDCMSLSKIDLPKSMEFLGKHIFENCQSLEEIKLPEGLEKIEDSSFKNCIKLNKIQFSPSIKIIGNEAFQNCLDLKSINLSKNITEINSRAFSGCTKLESLDLSNVKVLGINSFSGCEKLTSVVLSKDLKIIPDSLFIRCRALKNIDLNDGLTEISSAAFCGCSSLESVIIPDSVTNLGKRVFESCQNLKTIKLSKNIKDIKEGTFAYCSNLTEIDIPENIQQIGQDAFRECVHLKKINLNEGLKSICSGAFVDCYYLKYLEIPQSVKEIGYVAFKGCDNLEYIKCPFGVNELSDDMFKGLNMKFLYFSKDENSFILTKNRNQKLEKDFKCIEFNYRNLINISNEDFRKNYCQILEWKNENKIKFIPPNYVMEVFPNEQMSDFFKNGNNKRWRQIIQLAGFDKLDNLEKENTLTDLLKIYYAIGGFSTNQGESEKAYNYILDYVVNVKQKNYNYKKVASDIHTRFTRLELNGEYNPTFAQFFMKYYKDNPNFMKFVFTDEYGVVVEERDYLCQVHNSFNKILKLYHNRVVNGNEERELLTTRFLAEHYNIVEYLYIKKGNELLAEIIARYGYRQDQFERIQEIFEKAKEIKDKYVIQADKSKGVDGINFRILEKDDPLGFVLGDITNCCQHIGGAADSCVVDGYTNPEAGFIVFEETIFNEKGEDTGEKRILGQAYIWYDPKTKTVCFDNIEVPTNIREELLKGDKNGKTLSTKTLMKVVKESALAIIKKMNRNGIKVERVTTGEGYNDLANTLKKHFKIEKNPKAQHRNYAGYTDANYAQFIIATYDEITNKTAKNIISVANKVVEDLHDIKENCFQNNREI